MWKNQKIFNGTQKQFIQKKLLTQIGGILERWKEYFMKSTITGEQKLMIRKVWRNHLI